MLVFLLWVGNFELDLCSRKRSQVGRRGSTTETASSWGIHKRIESAVKTRQKNRNTYRHQLALNKRGKQQVRVKKYQTTPNCILQHWCPSTPSCAPSSWDEFLACATQARTKSPSTLVHPSEAEPVESIDSANVGMLNGASSVKIF